MLLTSIEIHFTSAMAVSLPDIVMLGQLLVHVPKCLMPQLNPHFPYSHILYIQNQPAFVYFLLRYSRNKGKSDWYGVVEQLPKPHPAISLYSLIDDETQPKIDRVWLDSTLISVSPVCPALSLCLWLIWT